MAVGQANAKPRLKRICPGDDGSLTISLIADSDTCGPAMTIVYARESQFAAFLAIDSFNNASATELVYKGLRAKYQNGSFFLAVKSGCAPPDSIAYSDTLDVDVEPPAPIGLRSVSVNADGKATIEGLPSAEQDVMGYILYSVSNGSNTPIDTFFGSPPAGFVDQSSNPSAGSERYRVAPFDSCMNLAPLGDPSATVFVSADSPNLCRRSVMLNWTAYQGFAVGRYDVYTTTGTQPIGTVKGNVLSIDLTIPTNVTISSYYVVAVSSADELLVSVSNIVTVTVPISQRPVPLLYQLSDLGTGALQLGFSIQNPAGLQRIEIWRGKSARSVRKIDQISPVPRGTYVDNTIEANTIYYYQIVTFDTCAGEPASSDTLNNMLLTLLDTADYRRLTWNPFILGGQKAYSYVIYRSFDGGKTYDSIAISPDESYRDYLELDTISAEGICYRVRAQLFPSPGGPSTWSYSSTACLIKPHTIFFPNAVVKEGKVPIYRPKGTFINYDRSRMYIFNRWGTQVFEGDLRTGWNLEFKGKPVPSGVYIYRVDLKGTDATNHYYQGTFTVLD